MEKVQILKKRAQIIRALRNFFENRDFLEISTPLLVPNPGLEPHLEYFETEFRTHFDKKVPTRRLFLPTSPEYHLKRALGEWSLPKIFEITKSFRNGETGTKHEPEFSMVEWYRSPGTYKEIAKDVEDLFLELGQDFSNEPKAWKNFKHTTVCEAYKEFADLDLKAALGEDPSLFAKRALLAGIQGIKPTDSFDTVFHLVMVSLIEPQLGLEGPEFLWDYPKAFAALARKKPEDPNFCERFEVYWRGVELANAFGELTSSEEQRLRCREDQKERLGLYPNQTPPPLDEAFLASLGRLPSEVGGIALGLDRLIQVLLGLPTLQDVIAFPHLNSV